MSAILLESLWHLFGTALNARGVPLNNEEIHEQVQRDLSAKAKYPNRDISCIVISPGGPPEGSTLQLPPQFTLGLTPLKSLPIGEYETWDDTDYIQGDADFLKDPLFRYADIWPTVPNREQPDGPPRFDVRRPANSARLVDVCKRVREKLDASFGFGEEVNSFMIPGLRDPRSRVWGLTYYGPGLVKEIGSEKLRAAPWHKVEDDPSGGLWCYLHELPFVPSPELEKRRQAVEKVLALPKLFPNVPEESGFSRRR